MTWLAGLDELVVVPIVRGCALSLADRYRARP
jgi:hypothetical protein